MNSTHEPSWQARTFARDKREKALGQTESRPIQREHPSLHPPLSLSPSWHRAHMQSGQTGQVRGSHLPVLAQVALRDRALRPAHMQISTASFPTQSCLLAAGCTPSLLRLDAKENTLSADSTHPMHTAAFKYSTATAAALKCWQKFYIKPQNDLYATLR